MTRIKLARLIRVGFVAALTIAAFVIATAGAGATGYPGAVYTATNAASGNQVVALARATNGTLTRAGTYDTGGLGTGAGLGSQGAVTLSRDGRWLLVVNAGSNDVSVFSVGPHGLTLTDREPSGGIMPVSVAISHQLVYVLNAGGSGNITGFNLNHDGTLAMIAGSSRNLSSSDAGAAQVSFSPRGDVLVVTEKATNRISTYTVGEDGRAQGPQVFASNGAVPFGFAFDNRDHAFISEAGPGAVSSYAVSANGAVTTVTASATTHQAAACWVVVTRNGKFAYTTNAQSASISGYRIADDGSIALLNPNGITATTGAGSAPIDMALSGNSHYLYALSAANGTIVGFHINHDGSLIQVLSLSDRGLAGAVGLAAQ